MDLPYFKCGESWTNILHDEVCYIPENNGLDKELIFTKQEFIDMCDGDELKAEMLFSICNWASPNTELIQWDEEDDKELEELRAKRSGGNE